MSLYIDLSINDERIGTVVVTRLQTGKPTHRYRWAHYLNPFKNEAPRAVGELNHREQDGAITLARMVLTDVEATL